MKTKYRILEIEGKFYPQSKVLLFWCFPHWLFYSQYHPEVDFISDVNFPTLEEAQNFIAEIENKKTPPPCKIHHVN